MSWQAYVDNNLVGKDVTHAAILGRKGGIWAKSKNINISAADQKSILSAFDNLQASSHPGFLLGGEKYMFLRSDSYGDTSHMVVHGKKKGDGAVLVQTKQAILVALYVFPQTAQAADVVATKLGTYLVTQNY